MDWAAIMSVIRLDQVAYPGIITLIIFLILTGKLNWHTVADDWKAAYFKMEEANRVLTRQNSDLIGANRTTERVVNSLPQVGGDKT